jgi:integrase
MLTDLSIPLCKPAAAPYARVLAAHRERQRAAGLPVADVDLVLTTSTGGPLHHATLQRQLARVAATVGLSELEFHDLRRTCATWLAEEGVPVAMAMELLGHRDAAMTLALYARVTDRQRDRAGAALEAALTPDSGQHGGQAPGAAAK